MPEFHKYTENDIVSEKEVNSNWLVGSAAKALSVLNCFNENNPELNLNKISKMMGIPKSTTLNLIRTLELHGYLYRVENTNNYRLGFKILELSYFVKSSLPIVRYAIVEMEELQQQTGKNVYLTTHRDGKLLYLESVFPGRRRIAYSVAGKVLPMHCTAAGKAMLSCMNIEQVEKVIGTWGLQPKTLNTITSEAVLFEELDRIRQCGYAVDMEEETLGVRCVATAIRNMNGEPVGALSISASQIDLTDENIIKYATLLSKSSNILSNYADSFPVLPLK